MIMADVFALFGTLLALGLALPGMLLAWQLLLPAVVTRAHLSGHYRGKRIMPGSFDKPPLLIYLLRHDDTRNKRQYSLANALSPA